MIGCSTTWKLDFARLYILFIETLKCSIQFCLCLLANFLTSIPVHWTLIILVVTNESSRSLSVEFGFPCQRFAMNILTSAPCRWRPEGTPQIVYKRAQCCQPLQNYHFYSVSSSSGLSQLQNCSVLSTVDYLAVNVLSMASRFLPFRWTWNMFGKCVEMNWVWGL